VPTASRGRPPRARQLGSPSTSRRRRQRAPCSCPCIKDADTLDFAGSSPPTRSSSARSEQQAHPDDFAGATITLTNPGTIGTVQSVPRLMPGQGVIVGVGNIDYPAEFQGADPAQPRRARVSKVITITSTYDHRIIQGAESGCS
jgi:multifunctional 2-oxoglutarate metabolism enzyme